MELAVEHAGAKDMRHLDSPAKAIERCLADSSVRTDGAGRRILHEGGRAGQVLVVEFPAQRPIVRTVTFAQWEFHPGITHPP